MQGRGVALAVTRKALTICGPKVQGGTGRTGQFWYSKKVDWRMTNWENGC